MVEQIFAPIADFLSSVVFYEIPIFGGLPIIIMWLMAGAIFTTVWLRFQPITGFKHSFHVIRGRYTAKTDPGEVSSFQALATELSGTVGLGNIAGVAVAISLGGPGAAVWIAIFGFFAMSLKMAEATLGVMYRKLNADGTTSGGPMYYLREGLKQKGYAKLGAGLAIAYAIFTLLGSFGASNLFQANQATAILADYTGGWLEENSWVIGVAMAAVTAAVILGGITSIAKFTSKVTPAMAVLYLLSVLAVIIANIDNLGTALASMFAGAFTASGVAGGAVGVAIIGIQRALFSNAAGLGTAGMAHSAAKTKDPATEGYVAMWEPLVDSIVVCMLTAVAITITGLYNNDGTIEGVSLTASAFATVASWFPILLVLAVVLFGMSTVLAYYYYFELAADYLSGNNTVVRWIARVVWVAGVLMGSVVSLDSVIAFADASLFLMAIPNILGIFFLAGELRLAILRHKYRVDTGALEMVPADLQVGMGDHEPSAEQVAEAERLEREEEERLAALHRKLEADPEFPVRAEGASEDLESPMGRPENPIGTN